MKSSLLPKLPGCRIVLALGLLWAPLAHAGWKNNPEAVTILGRAKLPSATTLFAPSGIAVNPASGKVFVVDGGNHRVLRFSSAAALGNGQAAEAVLGQVDFKSDAFGLSDSLLRDPGKAVVDAAGNLWLSDTGNYRILRWANADTIPSGSPAVQVLGSSTFTTRDTPPGASSLYRPGGLAFDASGSLWVADAWNNRVLRYDNPAAKGNGGAADHVIGQPDFVTTTPGLSATQFDEPYDLAIDSQGRLWVSDFDNVRVLRFDTPSAQILPAANGVLGQPDFVSKASGSGPAQANRFINLVVSPAGSLFVSDSQNYRIMRWDNAALKANGAPADGVLGRSSLLPDADYSGIGGTVSEPSDLALDPDGRLWMVLSRTERVLHWDAVLTKSGMADADGVIGEPSILSTIDTNFIPPAMPRAPHAGLEDAVSGKFFLADEGRVLRYSSRAAAEAGTAPEAVLGKSAASQYGGGSATGTNLRSAWGLALDGTGQLWVSDPRGNRIVAFAAAATSPTGAPMSVVLGQADFLTSTAGLAADRLNTPRTLAIDGNGHLYVADYGNHRVLRFNQIATKASGAAADAVIGQGDLLTASTASNAALLRNPSGLCFDAGGRLWVADTGKNRIARYDTPLAMAAADLPSGTLGGVASLSASGMSSPHSVAITTSGRLWVLDTGFQRVLRYENAAAKANGANADGVIGAATPASSISYGRALNRFYSPECLFLDSAQHLWVADPNNARALKFEPVSSVQILQSGFNPANRFELTFQVLDPGTYLLRSSPNLVDWELETTWQLSAQDTRTFEDAKGGARRFFRIEEP
ncbi:MAG: NHL repeat-containing protein [Verrucomicrobiota bacterium]